MHDIRIGLDQFFLPAGVSELTPDQTKRLGTLLLSQEEDELPVILRAVCTEKQQKMIFNLDPGQILAIANTQRWILEERKIEGMEEVIPLLPSFRIGVKRYYLPEKSLNDVTVNEWLWVEICMQALQSEADTRSAMNRLVAAVCRPYRSRDERFGQDYDGYPREKFNPELIPVREKIFSKAPEWVFAVVMDYLLRCKSMLLARYGIIFEGEKTSGPNWGWKGAVLSVAESGIFGKEKDVLNENIHNVCIYLAKKTFDAKAEEDRLTKLKKNEK